MPEAVSPFRGKTISGSGFKLPAVVLAKKRMV